MVQNSRVILMMLFSGLTTQTAQDLKQLVQKTLHTDENTPTCHFELKEKWLEQYFVVEATSEGKGKEPYAILELFNIFDEWWQVDYAQTRGSNKQSANVSTTSTKSGAACLMAIKVGKNETGLATVFCDEKDFVLQHFLYESILPDIEERLFETRWSLPYLSSFTSNF